MSKNDDDMVFKPFPRDIDKFIPQDKLVNSLTGHMLTYVDMNWLEVVLSKNEYDMVFKPFSRDIDEFIPQGQPAVPERPADYPIQ